MIKSSFMATLTILLIVSMMSSAMKPVKKNKANKTPFECGFSKMKDMKKIPFSIQFFMLSIMFIIFDIEVSVLVSMISPMSYWNKTQWTPPALMFIMTMVGGMMYEWKKSAMYWLK